LFLVGSSGGNDDFGVTVGEMGILVKKRRRVSLQEPRGWIINVKTCASATQRLRQLQ
jgi:hypothetical protein